MKYAKSKQEFGFCIPGYRVHEISSGELIKFGKEEGKTLGKESTLQGKYLDLILVTVFIV